MNYHETLEYIHSLGMFSHPASLSRITALLDKLGNPQNACPAIHIAGTNGKGSTAMMSATVFEMAGYKTGLFISPFVIDFRERIQINRNFISEDDLVHYSEQVIAVGVAVTEFEFITAVAFLYFAAQQCDILIIETGLGGRLDATNTLENPLVSVLTKIGLDHTAILGETIEKIATEKCGIIKSGVTVSCMNQPESAMEVIRSHAQKLIVPDTEKLKVLRCDLTGNEFIYRSCRYETGLTGAFQIENALTVIETVMQSGLAVSQSALFTGIKQARFPARLEMICQSPLLILDGAHNPDGAAVLAAAMKSYAGKIVAVIGMMRDKNYNKFLSVTLPLCRGVIAVRACNSPRSLTAEQMAQAAACYCENVVTADSYEAAIKRARKIAGNDPIFVFGSLYLAAGIRPLLLERED